MDDNVRAWLKTQIKVWGPECVKDGHAPYACGTGCLLPLLPLAHYIATLEAERRPTLVESYLELDAEHRRDFVGWLKDGGHL